MWSLALAFAQTPAPPESEPPEPAGPSVLLAVFDEAPSDEARQKVVRQAFRRSRTLHDGRDWGRVLCFRFDGPADRVAIERALAKVGLTAEIRTGPTCEEPPADAFLDQKPTAWRRVVFDPTIDAALAQKGLAPLLLLDLGLLGVKISPEVRGRACLELAQAPDDEALGFALRTVPFELTVEPAQSCGDALGGPSAADEFRRSPDGAGESL
jgi:hypothetical protein